METLSRCFIISIFAIVVLVCASSPSSTLVAATSGGSPWLIEADGDCFSTSIADKNICFPTRCQHLFNRSTSVVIPTPLDPSVASYPYNYPTFGCTVETVYKYYNSASLNSPCKVPKCACTSGANSGKFCYPTGKVGSPNNCDAHSCPA